MNVKCKECGTLTPEDSWLDADTPCETCGDHVAYKCPHCGEIYDGVWDWGKLELIDDLPLR